MTPVNPSLTCCREVECWKHAAIGYISARLAEHFEANPGAAALFDKYDEHVLRCRVKDRTLDGLARSYLQEFCHNTYDFADPAWEILFELHPHDSHRLLLTLK
jgi:hypothetical protein